MRLSHLTVFCSLFVLFLTASERICLATDKDKGVQIVDFKVTHLSPTKTQIDMKVAKSDLFRNFCIRVIRPAGKDALPPGFSVTSSGYTYLVRGNVKQNATLLADNGPCDENPAKNELRITLDTTNWPEGKYMVSVGAHNRPGPGAYSCDRRIFPIIIGNPPEIKNGGSNISGAVHRVVYQKEKIYACFPSLFATPEGTLVTNFGTRTRRSHIDPAGGSKRLVSKDGGKTWAPSNDRAYNVQRQTERGDLVRAYPRGWVYVDAKKRADLTKQDKRIMDVRPGKIAYLGGALSAKWDKQKKKWETTELDVPKYITGLMGYNNASNVKTKQGVRLVACYGRRVGKEASEVVLIRSEDDGRTWEVRPMWEAGLPDPKLGFNETALVETDNGTILAMMRTSQEGNLYQATSDDGGKSWSSPQKTPILGYPAHLLKLRDGRLLCTYGYRFEPMGIRACISDDNGKTWDIENEWILRSDGFASVSDLGYPVSHELPDGRIVTIYYHTTDGQNTHIATTHWKPQSTTPPVKLELVSAKKVWDKAPHNAFTDLIRYKDKWFLTFREAKCHLYTAPSGDIRVLSSEDGEKWESAALLKYGTDSDDLRDSKLSITPKGRLLLICALAPKENHKTRQSYAYLSDDGINWEGPHKIGEHNWWMWNVAWSPEGTAYGLGYQCGAKDVKQKMVRLYRSKDGLNYKTFLPRLTPQHSVNEAAMLFRKDGSAVTLVRRDGSAPSSAIVGTAKGDYSDWTFHELKQRIGGPAIIETPDGHILASGRLYDGKVRTSVGLLEPEAGKFTELLKLPSGGDCSYPGMAFHGGYLWVSYYSSHEGGKTGIYVAKIKVKSVSVN